ncbi:ThiJ/PfpI family protein [Geitlerinema sp. FC II]|uniref:type 1 glutamine amidotransferase domain-containing protein n=1 Tax=Baaleninema simplex TaxID=2862350 RepID=UPI0003751343|nr:type 1 glutamine amidotransferase domain-containing protein [Baaleninema simplex]PPT11107.1 ThiJ/PfpI family protein [Geitlerinema sp. FC II]
MVTTHNTSRPKIGILLENHFEDSEFQVPYRALQDAGAEVVVLGSRMNDEYTGKRGKVNVRPDATATEVRSDDFDAILIPGGAAPDRIRTNPNAVSIVMDAMAQGKLVAAICHGPQVLIEADQLRGKQATGYRAIRKDMQNAGATYIDEPLVMQDNLITARRPGDTPIFTTAILINLGLSLENTELPDVASENYEWWQLGETWGGSTRDEIVYALNTAISGENYTLKTFEEYGKRARDTELGVILAEVVTTKQRHIQLLEARLSAFGESVTWQAVGGDALAALQSWLQSNDSDMEIARRALGDLQTGVVDAYHLSSQLTDPITAALFDDIEERLALHERRFGDFCRARSQATVEPPMPTTLAFA